MPKILLFSYNGMSDENANGITIKNLLSAWPPEHKAQVYCDAQLPDFSAAHQHFRVTDMEVLKAFCGKRSCHSFSFSEEHRGVTGKSSPKAAARKIPVWLKKRKYNYLLRWLREILRSISPWGHRKLHRWIRDYDPDVLVYMVGESHYIDKLVLKTCKKTAKPLVLYNGEAYRIVDTKKRRGLERSYYRNCAKLYAKLHRRADLILYNSEMLKQDYGKRYGEHCPAMVSYNSAEGGLSPYVPREMPSLTYFGNLGVGRSEVLLEVAEILRRIAPAVPLHIYGSAEPEMEAQFRAAENICYHGFVDPQRLREVLDASDILLHVESFVPEISEKLAYAFSTKIAQCLCAGRCFLSYAPERMASSAYLRAETGVLVASTQQQLEEHLRSLLADPGLRLHFAQKAAAAGEKNHSMAHNSLAVRQSIEKLMQREGTI